MKRQVLQVHLAQAHRELAEVAARIERQKALIWKLERRGQDTIHATFLLHQSLGMRACHNLTGENRRASPSTSMRPCGGTAGCSKLEELRARTRCHFALRSNSSFVSAVTSSCPPNFSYSCAK